MRRRLDAILRDLYRTFGWKTRLYASVAGPYVAWTIKREQRRLAAGWTYEPTTLYQRNAAAQALAVRWPLGSKPWPSAGQPPRERAITPASPMA